MCASLRPPPPHHFLPPLFIFCVFLMLLFELIGNMFGKQAHAQRASESSADTHQLGRRPDSPPLCRATSQDAPLTTTMLIEVLIRRPGPNWHRLMGRDRRPGHGLAVLGCLDPESLVLDTLIIHGHQQLSYTKHFSSLRRGVSSLWRAVNG